MQALRLLCTIMEVKHYNLYMHADKHNLTECQQFGVCIAYKYFERLDYIKFVARCD